MAWSDFDVKVAQTMFVSTADSIKQSIYTVRGYTLRMSRNGASNINIGFFVGLRSSGHLQEHGVHELSSSPINGQGADFKLVS